MRDSTNKRLKLFELHCGVQHYAWGDRNFIPSLLGISNAEGKPYAELWMGAHPDLPSAIEVDGSVVPLNAFINTSPEAILGPAVVRDFGSRLPFLFKVISAAKPLSVQVHPSQEKAREGFARENAAGIPQGARNRNYHDDDHKPELIAALTDFYCLRGFRPLQKIAEILKEVPEFRQIMPEFQPTSTCLRILYEKIMYLPQEQVDSVFDPLMRRLEGADKKRAFTREKRGYWVLRADREYSEAGHRDRGLFFIYLLNLVHLRPGDALYLPAGIHHSYLEGAGIEIMASSNNVLRGGLTPKHVDVPELLENVTFEGSEPNMVRATRIVGTREWVYRTPAREFELRRVEITRGNPHHKEADHSVEIFVVAAGDPAGITVTSGEQILGLRRGGALLVPWGVPYTLRTHSEATVYKATVPERPAEISLQDSEPLFRGRRPSALRFGTSGLRGLV